MTPEQQIQNLEQRISSLTSQINDLSSAFYKNNFSAHQDFNKSCAFNVSLKVPVYTSLPNCEVGELAVSGGILYVASAKNVWTAVGTQS